MPNPDFPRTYTHAQPRRPRALRTESTHRAAQAHCRRGGAPDRGRRLARLPAGQAQGRIAAGHQRGRRPAEKRRDRRCAARTSAPFPRERAAANAARAARSGARGDALLRASRAATRRRRTRRHCRRAFRGLPAPARGSASRRSRCSCASTAFRTRSARGACGWSATSAPTCRYFFSAPDDSAIDLTVLAVRSAAPGAARSHRREADAAREPRERSRNCVRKRRRRPVADNR